LIGAEGFVRASKEDANYLYLGVTPQIYRDNDGVEKMRMAVFGPKTKFPYFPSRIFISRINGDSETWDFTKLRTNLPGIDKDTFKYVKVPGFTLREAPKLPEPTPEKISPDAPASEVSPTPTASQIMSVCPSAPTCCHVSRFRWRLLRNCR
jgi:hypothetical protein